MFYAITNYNFPLKKLFYIQVYYTRVWSYVAIITCTCTEGCDSSSVTKDSSIEMSRAQMKVKSCSNKNKNRLKKKS